MRRRNVGETLSDESIGWRGQGPSSRATLSNIHYKTTHTMEQYRLHFEVEQGADALPTIMDVRAHDIDQATETARAYLAMVSEDYHAVTVYEQWRSMWRSSGRRIIRTANT